MRNSLAIIALLVMNSSINPVLAAKQASADGKLRGWLVNQTLDYHGPVEIKATANGCRIHSKDLLMFFKPNQEVFMFSETNKTVAKIDKKVWLNGQAVNCRTSTCPEKILQRFKIPTAPPRNIAGLKCKQHWAVAFRHDKSFWYWCEYWTTDAMNLPTDVTNDYMAVLHLPSGGGFPLTATKHYGQISAPNHPTQAILSTASVKPIVVTDKELQPPTGYRQVADEMDVILGEAKGAKGQEDDEISKLLKAPSPGSFTKRK